MPFDEQLRRAFDTLSDHLRDEIGRQAAALAAELAASAAADRDQALAALRAERDAAIAAARERDDLVTATTAQHQAALSQATRDAAAAARDEAERDAVSRIQNATAIAEARGRERASAEAQARVAELQAALEEAEQRARIAQQESRDASARAAEAARAAADRPASDSIARLAGNLRAIDSETSLKGILSALVQAAGGEAPRSAVLLVEHGGFRPWRTNALVATGSFGYADAGIVAEAARDLRLVAASGRTGEIPGFAGLASGAAAVAVPIVIAGRAVAVLYADLAGAPATGDEWSGAIELLVRHASATLEAVTAFKVARALAAAPDSAAARGEATDEHESARRYARLLVSEIKLYHEPEVLAGRRERDLGTRLGGQIERARALYQERVPASIRATTDYFHAEIVRTLASGDASLVGEIKA